MKKSLGMRRAIDVLMILALFSLMGFQYWGETVHEWLGLAMGVLFILHQIFNRRWYHSLRHGPYSLMRGFHIAVDLLAAVTMAALLGSGIVLSGDVFGFVRLPGLIAPAQRTHLVASHWLYVLLSLHLGLHGRRLFDRPFKYGMWFWKIIGAIFALYGVAAFVSRDFFDVMFLRVHFLFLDGSEPLWHYYIDHLAIMVCFALAAYELERVLRHMRRGR